MGGSKKKTDMELRERLRKWVVHIMEERKPVDHTQAAFAAKIGIAPATLTQILNGDKTIGLDIMVRIRRTLHQSIDQMVDDNPPMSAGLSRSSTATRKEA